MRLPDRHADIRTTLHLRLFHAADEPRIFVGPRRVRSGVGDPESAVGHGSTFCRRHRRPLRQPARDRGWRGDVRRGADHDALCLHAAVTRSQRRRFDRLRIVRLFVQSGAVGVRKASAARMARRCARRRHRGRLVRAIRVCAVWCRHARQFRLAAGADRVCLFDAAGGAAVPGPGNADDLGFEGRRHDRPADIQACAGRGIRSSVLCVAGARLLYLRISAGVHHRASAGLSGRSRHAGSDRRLGDRRHRPVQYRRLAQRRMAAEQVAEALYPLGDLLYPCNVDCGIHHLSDHHLLGDRVRRRHRPDLAVDGAADLEPGRPDVRDPLACDAVRLRILQPSGRRFPRRSAWRYRVREIRVIHADLVAVGAVWRAVGADQPADRRSAGEAPGCTTGLDRSRFIHQETTVRERGVGTFRAIRIDKAEKGTTVALTQFDEAELMDGDVTIRVEWSTLNYKDGLAVTGKAPVVRRFPMIGGIDLAGTVEQSTHPHWKAGDSVICNGWGMGETHLGAYGGKARVKGDWLVRLPNGMSARDAMAIGTAGYTAMLSVLALEKHGLTPKDGPVVVTGAAGGVGSVATAVLSKLGYQVIASTGRVSETDYLKSLGAAEVIDRAELSGPAKPLAKERWGGGIDR